MPVTNQREIALVTRAKNGDVDAFGELYALHLDAIYRYIFYRINNTQDAEDLTEQTFLKAYEALPRYQQRGKPFSSWLYRIAHNVVIDHHRRDKGIVVNLAETYEWDLDNKQISALQEIVNTEEIQTLATAIAQLSSEQQQVIILRFMEGFSHKEVAQILDKKEGACRMIQYRALLSLQQLLSDYYS